MYRYAFLLLCLGVMKPSFSQSKKEQIEILNKRVDSLTQVVSSKDKRINDQTSQINSLNSNITSLEGMITSLNSNVSKLNSEVQTLSSDSKNKQQEINQKKEEINRLKDSLTLLKGELEKLKPVVKPVVNNTPVKNAPPGPYKTVTIGTQVWMKENLNVSTFRNGDSIPEAKTEEEWRAAGDAKQPAWCYYDNDPKNGEKYGKLYNWYAVNDSRGLAPAGYHVPTDEEWSVLIGFLGDDAGKKMKSTSGWKPHEYGGFKTCPKCSSWNSEYRTKTACHTCLDTRYVPAPIVSQNGNGNNISGFSGLPGGECWSTSRGLSIGTRGSYWSSSMIEDSPKYIFFSNNYDGVTRSNTYKNYGLSIRCIRSRIVFGQDPPIEVNMDNNSSAPMTQDINVGLNNSNSGGGAGTGEGPSFGGTTDLDRIRIKDPILPRYNTDVDLKVHLKLIVAGDGSVINAVCIKSKTTTTDQTIINDVIREVKKQVLYKKDPEGRSGVCYYTVNIKAK